MKSIWTGIQLSFSALGGFLGWYLGGMDGFLYALIAFVLVGIGNLVDVYVLGQEGVLRTAVIFFYLSNEGISFLENAGRLGLPIPARLKDVLEQLHDKGGSDNESA